MSTPPYLLWLPGWSVGPDVFAAAANQLAGRHSFCDFSVCARGESYDRVIDAALSEAGEQVTIIGWSMGAMLALETASRRPEQVRRLCLVSSSGQFVTDDANGCSSRALRSMQLRLERDPRGVQDDFDSRMFSPAERAERLDEKWAAGRGTDQPLSALRAGLAFLSNFNFYSREVAIDVPTALLHGESDAICAIGGAHRLAGHLPDCQLTTWEETGHIPLFAQPARFVDWLSEVIR